jgi:DNA-binding FadR family transcriptional regulator
VHIAKAGAIVRIDLATRTATEIVGAISDRDVKRAERLVARHAKHLQEEWTKIHGND